MATEICEFAVRDCKRLVFLERLKGDERPLRLRVVDRGSSGGIDVGLELSVPQWRVLAEAVQAELVLREGGNG